MNHFVSNDGLVRDCMPQEIISSGDALLSVELDVVGDQQWFRDNPAATERRRPATADEQAISGYPPGTVIRLVRQPSGVLHRIFPRRARSQR